jgi:hypothetical protein
MRSVLPLTVLAMCFTSSVAHAHKMIVVPTVAEALRVKVGYEDKTPAEGATVTLKDEAGDVVVEGITDDTGVCVLPRPKPGRYTVIANDGAGHRTQVPFDIPDEKSVVGSGDTTASLLSRRWVRAVIGVTVIGAVSLIIWWVRRRR